MAKLSLLLLELQNLEVSEVLVKVLALLVMLRPGRFPV